jgi:hypothetical protein
MSEVTDLDFFYGGIRDNVDHPHSFLMHPSTHLLVPTLVRSGPCWFCRCHFALDSYFTNVLPRVSTAWWLFFMTRGDHYTYQLDGPDAIFPEKVTPRHELRLHGG